MARQILNNGSAANDGTGDTLRDAADKINANFRDLYTVLGDSDALSAKVSFDSDAVRFGNFINPNTITLSSNGGGNAALILPDSSGEILVSTATQSTSNKTISDSIINTTTLNSPAISTAIYGDSSTGSEIIKLVNTNQAVNEITITNAVSGSEPTIYASGDDASIDLTIGGKGQGLVEIGSSFAYDFDSVGPGVVLTNDEIPMSKSLTIFSYPILDPTIVVPDGTHEGQLVTLLNKGTGTAGYVRLDISSYAHNGGSQKLFDLRRYGACQLIWSTAGWHLLGDSNSSHFL